MAEWVPGRLIVKHGDCLDVMRSRKADSIDAIVTDPPYGLGFMGEAWDTLPPGDEWAKECLRVLKPGGHLLAFGGTRTSHRLACAIEDAGFEIRDSIAWLYGSGFPKSLDVSKAIDKGSWIKDNGREFITDDAATWQGWGTALKPAHEPIIVARKPPVSTVAANVLAHGTGALNIDACRIETSDNLGGGAYAESGNRQVSGSLSPTGMNVPGKTVGVKFVQPPGRWPANVILDESQAAVLDAQTGTLAPGHHPKKRGKGAISTSGHAGQDDLTERFSESGGASRFFYVAKAPVKERPKIDGQPGHPTVKPLTLMRYLVRLVTPPDGVVLDPFLGSGTTAEACLLEGFRCYGIEREESYLALIEARLTKAGFM